MTLTLFAAIFSSAWGHLDKILEFHQTHKRWRDADMRCADAGEDIASLMDSVENGNTRLKALANMCAAASLAPPAVAALKATAKGVVTFQKYHLLRLKAEEMRLFFYGSPRLARHRRMPFSLPPNPCMVPGPITWTERRPGLRFSYTERQAGFEVFYQQRQSRWRFHHPEVQPL